MNVTNNKRQYTEYLIPIILSAIFFGLVFNYDIINPKNIGWLAGDRLQSYLGWEFFRNSPWSFPVIGRTDYGMELSSSIVYTDSNPWLSIIFKILSPLLPDVFQFSGGWLLFCVMAQAIVLWKIIGLFSSDKIIKTLAVSFLLLNPAWINRSGHLMLMAFFIFTTGIYFSLKFIKNNEFNTIKWLCLLCAAIGTHFYIFFLVFTNWFVIFCYSYLYKFKDRKKLVLMFAVNAFCCLMLFYALGYLAVEGNTSVGGGPNGFGYFKANLLFPIIAGGTSIISGLNFYHSGEYEGYNYFGFGFILLIIINIICRKTNIFTAAKYNAPLFIFCAICVLLAISNIVSVGPYEFTIPLPDFMLNILGNFRASGRFLWPVVIVIYLYFICCSLKFKYNKSLFVLAICVTLQIVDLSNSIARIHKSFSSNTGADFTAYNEYLPLWDKYLSGYHNIRWFPTQNASPKWDVISYLSNKYHQNTDGIYYARVNDNKVTSQLREMSTKLAAADYDSDTAVLMNKDFSSFISLKEGDAILKYKDLYLLMPGKSHCDDCSVVTPSLPDQKNINFSSDSIGSIFLGKGWNDNESWGVWSSGPISELLVPFYSKKLDINFDAFLIPNKHESMSVSFFCNEKMISKFDVTLVSSRNVTLDLDKCAQSNKTPIKVIMKVDKPASPKNIFKGSTDSRIMGLGLKSMIIRE